MANPEQSVHCLGLKGHSQFWDRADLDTSFLALKKVHSPQPEIEVHLEIRFNLRCVKVGIF